MNEYWGLQSLQIHSILVLVAGKLWISAARSALAALLFSSLSVCCVDNSMLPDSIAGGGSHP